MDPGEVPRDQLLDVTTNEGSEEDLCAICLQGVTNRAVVVPCNHLVFDFDCLVTWLKQSLACPLCKANVTQVEYDWRSPTDYKIFRISRATKLTYVHHQDERRPALLPRDVALESRQAVYRNGLRSLHIGLSRQSGHRGFTPSEFSASEFLIRKARSFLRRELRVFAFLRPGIDVQPRSRIRINTSEYLIELIIAILKTNELKGHDGKAEDMLADFLGRKNAGILLHELQAWLESPGDTLEDWDATVQYLPLRDARSKNGRG